MSSDKCTKVTISSADYNRLRSNARRADRAAANAQHRAEAERRRNRVLENEILEEQRRARRDFDAALQSVSHEIRAVEEAQAARLDSLREAVRNDLAQHRREVSASLREHRESVERSLNAIRTEIASDKAVSRDIAERRIADVETLLTQLASDPATNRFAPGEAESLRLRLEDARSMVAAGQHQAALSGAQQCFHEYQQLRAKVALIEGEWRHRLDLALRRSEAVAGEIAASELAEFTFAEGTNTAVAAEVDYWTEGALTELRTRYRQLAGPLESPEACSTAQLEEIDARAA